MGGCCSDVSEVPDVILPDPEDGKGYKVSMVAKSAIVGDTYEIFQDCDETKKWLNIRRYNNGNQREYRLENYVRAEGADEGERLAYAQGNNFEKDMYHYKKPEQESSDSGDEGFSDSPDDDGEFTIHKSKWNVKNEFKIFNKAGEEVGTLKAKAKGKVIRTSTFHEDEQEDGTVKKYWTKEYEAKIKKIKYKIALPGHDEVTFKFKKAADKSFAANCAAFNSEFLDGSHSMVESMDGYDPCSAFLMGFICTQVLCPGDIHDGCKDELRYHDDIFPELEI